MKLTTILCSAYLILTGVFLTVFAFSGFDLLLFLCFYNQAVYRALLSLTGVAAAWLAFWLAAFRPTDPLS